MPRKRATPPLEAFGARLRELRGKRSRQQVSNDLQKWGVSLDESTLVGYEKGTVWAVDVAVMLGLAKVYGVTFAKHKKQTTQKNTDLRAFSNSGMHGSVMTAIEHCNSKRAEKNLDPLPKVRPYDVRHSFGTLMALIVKDERALQDLLIHASPKMVRHYTELATEPRTTAAIGALAKAIESGKAFRSLKLAVGNFGNFEPPTGPESPRKSAPLELAKGAKNRGK